MYRCIFHRFLIGTTVLDNVPATNNTYDMFRLPKALANEKWYVAEYSSFAVDNESTKYVMTVAGYSGNATDSFSYQTGMPFTTADMDNDQYAGKDHNCANYEGGGFWYNNCAHAHVANKVGVGNDFVWDNLPTGSSARLVYSRMSLIC